MKKSNSTEDTDIFHEFNPTTHSTLPDMGISIHEQMQIYCSGHRRESDNCEITCLGFNHDSVPMITSGFEPTRCVISAG